MKGNIRNKVITVVAIVLLILGRYFGIDYLNVEQPSPQTSVETQRELSFRNDKSLEDHFNKHKSEFSHKTKQEYVKGANDVISSPDSLKKTEEEDGDLIYYNEKKNEIVFVSKDGYIRTYFRPSSGKDYFNRQ